MMENEKEELDMDAESSVGAEDVTEDVQEPGSDGTDPVDEETDSAESDSKPSGGILRVLSGVFDFVEIMVFSVCIVLVLFSFVGRLCAVSGQSMEKTLYNGEQLLISNVGGSVESGDIIVFHMTNKNPRSFLNEPLVKRVIATGGDTVQIDYDSCRVYVNGEPMEDESLFVYLDAGCYRDSGGFIYTGKTETIEVPEGYLFVMGDNRNHSTDSRDPVVSFVDERRVLGKVVCRLSPFAWADDLKGNVK